MPVEDGIAALKPDMTDWRRYLHAHAETAFQERETAAFVAARLREFGIEVHEGLAGTGVVGTLRNGDGPAIGLRADLDGLPIAEETGLPYASKHAGRMHACGHDGHTAMLLGAARHLAQTR
ncbi:MAG TPA: M20/M25/M40 family metallo-hydrolase, partial [Candidatus Defluviicoccus seviourii]|nr:M20/M25/M40 family metallo-hydrolase [Candidatus Defluviicoccus seviourii]